MIEFVAKVFICLIAASCSLCQQCPDTLQADVLILGAGMAGITAGKTLSDRGIDSFIILEGGNDIGGRVKAMEFESVTVELGANWIQGLFADGTPETNPIWPLIARYNLSAELSDYDDIAVYTAVDAANSTKVAEGDVTKVSDELYDILDKDAELSTSRQNSGKSDISVRTALRLSGWSPDSNDNLARVLEWYLHDYCFAEPPELTSLQNNIPLYTYDNYGDNDYFVTDQRGFSTIIKGLANEYLTPNYSSDPRLHLNEVVRRIEWSDSCVCATVEKTDRSNQTYCAKTAVHTFSLGTLQAGTVEFIPPLPNNKLTAINSYDFAYYLKVFALFNESFWDGNEYILYGAFQRGYYPVIQPLNARNGKFFPANTSILLFTVTRFQAVRVSTQPKHVTMSEIYEVLKSMYGDNAQPPVDILVPDWIQNPLFHGMFSNYPPGFTEEMYQNFIRPAGALLFSGEATDENDAGFVQGAYSAGITGAEQAVEFLQALNGTNTSSAVPRMLSSLLIIGVLLIFSLQML